MPTRNKTTGEKACFIGAGVRTPGDLHAHRFCQRPECFCVGLAFPVKLTSQFGLSTQSTPTSRSARPRP